MSRHSTKNFFLTLTAMLVSAPVAMAGMAHVDCHSPFVFTSASVNVVVLPYTQGSRSFDPSLADIGNRLSLLVKLDVLSHILGYGSVGAVQMEMPEGTHSDGGCSPDNVLPVLLGARPPNLAFPVSQDTQNQLRPGNGLVLVWGLVYAEGDDIFVQTYARFLRRDVDEKLPIQAGGVSFSATPSSQMLAFTPQKLTRSDLAQIEESYRAADIVHDQPSDNSPGQPLPKLVAKCTGLNCYDSAIHAGYYVREKKGEWIRIQYIEPIQGQRKEGWIHSSIGVAGKALDQVLPELKFLEGSAGYLALRVSDAAGQPPQPGAGVLAIQQLNSFIASDQNDPDDAADAVALQLEGAVEYLTGGKQIESVSKVAGYFEHARAILPYDPNAISLAVFAQMATEWKQKGKCERTVQKSEQLSAALAFHPDKVTLTNLLNFYSLLAKNPAPIVTGDDLDKDALSQRAAALATVKVQ